MRKDLTTNLDGLKQCIPKLTAAAQACIRSPQNDNARVNTKCLCCGYTVEPVNVGHLKMRTPT